MPSQAAHIIILKSQSFSLGVAPSPNEEQRDLTSQAALEKLNFPAAWIWMETQRNFKKQWNWYKAPHLDQSRLKHIFPYYLHVCLAFISIEKLCLVRNKQNWRQQLVLEPAFLGSIQIHCCAAAHWGHQQVRKLAMERKFLSIVSDIKPMSISMWHLSVTYSLFTSLTQSILMNALL